MATLKEYLEKVALKVGSRGAMPGTQTITLKENATLNGFYYTAPSDGYIYAIDTWGDTGGTLFAQINGIIGVSSIKSSTSGYSRARVFLPMKKGQEVLVSSYSDMLKGVYVYFTKSVGGGLKSLIYKLFPEVRYAYA